VSAYVSDIRCDELLEKYPEQVSMDCRFFQVFGSVAQKIELQWAESGGILGYAEHVRHVIAGFDHVSVHPEVWLREAFFSRCADVSKRSQLLEVAEQVGLSAARVEAFLDSGDAHAALCEDLELAREQSVRASPTLVFNEGRQRLTGNVGYRIIEANVRELLERPAGQHSWC
jgi:hypothetical protein